MISEFKELAEKIDRLAVLTATLRRENADLRQMNAMLSADNVQHAQVNAALAADNIAHLRRLADVHDRVEALLAKMPEQDGLPDMDDEEVP